MTAKIDQRVAVIRQMKAKLQATNEITRSTYETNKETIPETATQKSAIIIPANSPTDDVDCDPRENCDARDNYDAHRPNELQDKIEEPKSDSKKKDDYTDEQSAQIDDLQLITSRMHAEHEWKNWDGSCQITIWTNDGRSTERRELTKSRTIFGLSHVRDVRSR
ncbi:hypothetical protein HELRODRAFT_169186 [Helobdella robusta]|uniref:Uncharacterized protein n=1 Tax=Helobdella robusta TaxID=6412 RepID=T1F1J6_HELRO|nr:hypothetical protein HELRODRAFT_169186 [Helobdella robusta]ESO08369.1 hypothetical protein HELRODRAFT_169186 [Helobdella robusta]